MCFGGTAKQAITQAQQATPAMQAGKTPMGTADGSRAQDLMKRRMGLAQTIFAPTGAMATTPTTTKTILGA